jgi:Arc/MetJ family transcription regulator
MAEDGESSTPVKEALKQWIVLDDELRAIQKRAKDIRTQKQALGDVVLTFMRENDVDDFKLEGNSAGTISRSTRTVKPVIKRNTIRTQLLLHFSDQPQKVSEALRAIEGIPEGDDAGSVAVQKELLTRRVPKK